jgi:hypothetical protein
MIKALILRLFSHSFRGRGLDRLPGYSRFMLGITSGRHLYIRALSETTIENFLPTEIRRPDLADILDPAERSNQTNGTK